MFLISIILAILLVIIFLSGLLVLNTKGLWLIDKSHKLTEIQKQDIINTNNIGGICRYIALCLFSLCIYIICIWLGCYFKLKELILYSSIVEITFIIFSVFYINISKKYKMDTYKKIKNNQNKRKIKLKKAQESKNKNIIEEKEAINENSTNLTQTKDSQKSLEQNSSTVKTTSSSYTRKTTQDILNEAEEMEKERVNNLANISKQKEKNTFTPKKPNIDSAPNNLEELIYPTHKKEKTRNLKTENKKRFIPKKPAPFETKTNKKFIPKKPKLDTYDDSTNSKKFIPKKPKLNNIDDPKVFIPKKPKLDN